MIGDGIKAVEDGMNSFMQTLRRDPRCLESVWVSIITFSGTATQVVPLSELTDVSVPPLKVSPGTALGAGFQLLRSCIHQEVTQTSADRKGDWRPLVFVITDGQPTDNFQLSLDAVNDMKSPRIANIYAIGCGDDVDHGQLNEVSDIVLRLESLESEGFRKLFVWLTASVQTASIEIDRTSADQDGINLDKLPKELIQVAEGQPRRNDARPRQVFIKALCSKTKRPYLMRYSLVPEAGYYEPVRSHRLDPEEFDPEAGEFVLPSISSDLLAGPAPCPHCENAGAGGCACGQIFCVSEPFPPSVQCPSCHQILQSGGGASSFEIQQSEG